MTDESLTDYILQDLDHSGEYDVLDGEGDAVGDLLGVPRRSVRNFFETIDGDKTVWVVAPALEMDRSGKVTVDELMVRL